jgi:hypothetical protein
MIWFDLNNRLTLIKGGFKQQTSLFRSVTTKWQDIHEAFGIKRNIITYDCNYIILKTQNKSATLGETDANFKNFEPHLINALPGFPADWYELIEAQPFDTPILLWKA